MRRLAAILLFLVLAAPASAAAPWSPPAAASDIERGGMFHPSLAFSADGAALAVWPWFEGTGTAVRQGASFAPRRPGATAFGGERILPGGRDLPAGPITYARSRALIAFTRTHQTRLEVDFGSTGGTFANPTTIARGGTRIVAPQVASNARGDLAVAWFDDRGVANDRVYVALRRPGHGFGAPIRLAQERVRGVSVAVGARGEVLVAWDAFGKVRTRIRDAGGHAFHSPDTIRSEDAYSARLRTAVLPSGAAVVGWAAQFLSEGGDRGDAFIQAAVRSAGGHGFHTAQVLERDSQMLAQDSGLELAVDATGHALAGWTGHEGAVARVRVADLEGFRFGNPQTVSPAGEDAVLQSLAAGAGGAAVAVWDFGDFRDENRISAVYRGGPGAFGAPEAVSDPGVVARPDAAFDPDGIPTVVWEQRLASGRFAVMAAARG